MSYSTLMAGPERRRRWSEDQKLAILAAAFSPGGSVVEAARQADVCTSLIYRWRESYLGRDRRPGAWRCRSRKGWAETPSPATSTSFGGAAVR